MTCAIRIGVLAAAGLLPACVVLQQLLPAQEVNPAPSADVAADQQILVLQNGGVLHGQISRDGDSYVVTGRGGEMRIADGSVLLVADSLEEAYEERRSRIDRPSAEAHLALAAWSLRHGLTTQAADELASAHELDRSHPRLVLLERRIALAANRAPAQPATAAQHYSADTVSDASPQGGEPVGYSPAIPDFRPSTLPDGAMERFTRKVQPVLVNTCTNTGCHQPGGSEPFQLDRALLHGLGNRRTTMHNLAAALALIDHDEPRRSPLLTIPRQTHGGMEGPAFGPRHEAAFQHLVEWVALVTQTVDLWDESPDAAPRHDGPQLAGGLSDPQQLGGVELVAAALPQGGADRLDPEPEAAAIQLHSLDDADWLLPTAQPLRVGAELQPWEPRDEFDPEIFNRQQRFAPSAAPPGPAGQGKGSR